MRLLPGENSADFEAMWVRATCIMAIWMAAVVPIVLGETATEPPRRHGSFTDGGFYACGVRFGGTLSHRRVSVESDINAWLREQNQKGHLVVVHLEEPGRWRAGQKSHKRLRQWLERTELPRIDILHFGEENPYDAGNWLNPLYDIVKDYDADLPVYVWYSMPLGPGSAKADGYWYDYYGQGYTSFREKVREYLATGKPLGMTVDFSLYSSLEKAREQVMVCKEFDLPVNYFACHHGAGHCTGWYQGSQGYALFVPARNALFSALELQRRSRPPYSLTAGDFFWGEVIELAPDTEGRIDHSWAGLGEATVYGFRSIATTDGIVRTSGGRPVSLDYKFWSLLPIEHCRLELHRVDGKTLPRVEISRSGAPDEWRPVDVDGDHSMLALSEDATWLREFRIRLTFEDPEAVFAGARVVGDAVMPEDRAIALYPEFYHGWRGGIEYEQRLDAGLWRILGRLDGGKHLEPGPALAMRGTHGRAVSSEVVQKFTSTQPLKNLVVRLEGSHNSTNLGGSTSLGVSLDGENVLTEGTFDGVADSGGQWNGVHIADLREAETFDGVREFYVHLRQRNGSGIRSHVSSRLKTLQIKASVEGESQSD